MRILIIGVALALVVVVGWEIGTRLSTDALGMVLGVMFGMMAGIPAALIALTSSRTAQVHHHHHFADNSSRCPTVLTSADVSERLRGSTSIALMNSRSECWTVVEPSKLEVKR